jgi:hypothetical protein
MQKETGYSMPQYLIRWVPWLLTVAIFGFIFRRVPLSTVLEALRQVPLGNYLAVMLLYSLIYSALDAFVLQRLIVWFHTTVPYRRILPVRAAAYILAILNPSLGHGAVAFALHQRHGLPWLEVASSLLFLTVLEFCQLALYAAVGLSSFYPQLIPAFAPVYVLLATGLGVGLWCVHQDDDPLAWILTRIGRWRRGDPTYCAPARLARSSLLRTFKQARLRHYLLTLLYKAPNFFLAVTVHYLALQWFGVQVPWLRLFGLLPLVFLVASLPVTVAHLGTSQAAWLYFFAAYGEASQILAYSLLAHVTFMVLNGAIGVCFLRSALRKESFQEDLPTVSLWNRHGITVRRTEERQAITHIAKFWLSSTAGYITVTDIHQIIIR